MTQESIHLSNVQYQTLYCNVLVLDTKLHFPFDNLRVDWGNGPVYIATLRNQPYWVQSTTNNSSVFGIVSNEVQASPMLPLHGIFQDHRSDCTEWLFVYKKCDPLLAYLEEHISSMTIKQSLVIINSIVNALKDRNVDDNSIKKIKVNLECIFIDIETKEVFFSLEER
ncbi:hypothetical protein SAMD00019534_114500 [Acytostelium subglobosum LB1]|uniref:hypothetical protein n=1 Tax=Acytostelium subglobosum LB1 TaxID=1410327 RepID=UPI0006447B2B|nr:hypothetical protein SAMD00019534_114500 [Acytostelium subglobosum LB1]GAM28274.1 hypothetical protein SAMD00019534_114500 [Acytostelium subglobosum LB1]|eukprot:XP_012748908.1 hypothetical protein SAMD00019534_114500 [Acytostelium subglobosum LB1]